MYRVYGYNEFCEDFDFTCSFIQMIQFLQRQPLSVIFVDGIMSEKVKQRLLL